MAQLQLLVTASVTPFRDRIEADDDPLGLVDLPSFGAGELGVRGLSITSSMLAGVSSATLEALRDAGDKARCPMLLLVEDQPLELASPDPSRRAAAVERIGKLSKAAGILGCAQLGISIAGEDGDGEFELAASTVRDTMQRIDRFEVSLLVRPVAGLTADPDRLTELIKKIGGFRIGSLPDFRAAHDTGDFVGALRRLAPYAGTILATVGKSGPGGKIASGKADKTPFDLVEGLEAVLAVGYQHAICLDHVGGPNAANTIVESRARIEAALAPEEEPSSDDVVVGEDG
ncbi:MAG: hypothetical protein VX726_13815 [Planctomycetota bacterium]|nr:hypothetical protein [Planctomycetota bacterium]